MSVAEAVAVVRCVDTIFEVDLNKGLRSILLSREVLPTPSSPAITTLIRFHGFNSIVEGSLATIGSCWSCCGVRRQMTQ